MIGIVTAVLLLVVPVIQLLISVVVFRMDQALVVLQMLTVVMVVDVIPEFISVKVVELEHLVQIQIYVVQVLVKMVSVVVFQTKQYAPKMLTVVVVVDVIPALTLLLMCV